MRPAPQTALLTLDEAAARLHVSRRWLQGFLRGKPYGKMAGRKRLFTEIDVAAIYEELPCPSTSRRRKPAARPLTGFEGPTSASKLSEALKLATEGRRKPCSTGSRTPSNVALFPKGRS